MSKQQVRVTYYGVEGVGETLTKAKQDAGRQIESALAGDYTPELLTWREYTVLVYREPGGWHQVLVADPEGPRDGRLYGCLEGTRADAVDQAASHLAQLGWKPEDGVDLPVELLGRISSREQRRAQGDHRHWAEWQLRFRAGREAGLEVNECHDYAGRNPACDYAALEARVLAHKYAAASAS